MIASSIVAALYDKEIEENYMLIGEHGQTISNYFKKFRGLQMHASMVNYQLTELIDIVVGDLEETSQAFVISTLGLTQEYES